MWQFVLKMLSMWSFFNFTPSILQKQALSPTNSSWRCWNVTWQEITSRCVGLRLGGSTRSAWNGGEDRASVWWLWLKVFCCLWNMSISHRVVLIWSLKSKWLINIWSILEIKEEYFHPIINILTYRLYTYMHPICNLEIINKIIYMCI